MSAGLTGDGSSQRIEMLVRAVAAHLDTVISALDEEHRGELRALLTRASGRPPRETLRALEEVLLWADLPDGHPVSLALASDRYAGGSSPASTLPPQAAVELLLAAVAGRAETSVDPPRPETPTPPDPACPQAGDLAEFGSHEAVVQRILALPALTPDQVRGAGADPDRSDLIRLGDGKAVRLPQFQFDGEGTPRDVVLDVNRALGVDRDPWGVTSWWIDLHAWLELAPVDLLDEPGGCDELSELARAEVAA